MNWEESRTYCQNMHGDLITIESLTEKEYVLKMIGHEIAPETKSIIWVGINYNGDDWKWVDGSPIDTSITKWSNNNPSSDHSYLGAITTSGFFENDKAIGNSQFCM